MQLIEIANYQILFIIYGRYHEMTQKACEGGICHVMAISFSPKYPKIDGYQFRSLFGKHVTCFFSEKPHFFMFENLEMPYFSHFQNQIGKMGHFEEKSRDQILKRKKIVFDFRTFQRKMQMSSPDKYLIDMLFGVFPGTSRILLSNIFFILQFW